MKTSEFRKYLESSGYFVDEEIDSYFLIMDSIEVYKQEQKIIYKESCEWSMTPQSYQLLINIANYLNTPLEEREEPKMYRLLIPNTIMLPGLNTGYLIKQHGFNIIVSEKGIKDDLWTQKEIDEIPDNIRNFFIKEEV